MRPSKRNVLIIVIGVALLGIGVVYFFARENANIVVSVSQTRPSVVGLGVVTTTAQINSNNFNTTGQASPLSTATTTFLSGMRMTFDEEFNTFSRYVDANGNVTCDPGGTGIWQTVYYFCSRTSPSNDEAEVYIDPGFLAYLKNESESTAETDSDNPFAISNGILSIKAAPSSQQVLSAVGSWAKYTSGMITTQFSFSQQYGYFEMRAKLPAGKGLWPAFWLLPVNKAWPPEIDALEAFGAPNPQGEGGLTMIHYGSHALTSAENCGGWHDVGVDITQGFHTYGVDVEPTGITYYFDGKPYTTCPANSAVTEPLYMIVNLAVGGTGSWPGTPGSSNVWPAYLYVDYVRAYQKI
jgi:beta-glucanase (GH16 family)